MPILWQKKMETVIIDVRGLPEFSYLLSVDRSKWPRCLPWHGWLPGLSCNGDRAPWAASFGQLACSFFVKKWMEMGTYFGSVLSPSLQHVRELPEFVSLMSLDRSKWPRCLLWHGWLPGLSDISDGDPWASSFGELAFGELEWCLGAYPVDFSGSWTPPDYWDADDIALEMSDHPNI